MSSLYYLITLLLFCSGISCQLSIFVAVDGSDQFGDGTINNPFQTISAAQLFIRNNVTKSAYSGMVRYLIQPQKNRNLFVFQFDGFGSVHDQNQSAIFRNWFVWKIFTSRSVVVYTSNKLRSLSPPKTLAPILPALYTGNFKRVILLAKSKSQRFIFRQFNPATQTNFFLWFAYASLNRSYNGEEVRLIGGATIGGWSKVSDPTILNRLKDTAKANVGLKVESIRSSNLQLL